MEHRRDKWGRTLEGRSVWGSCSSSWPAGTDLDIDSPTRKVNFFEKRYSPKTVPDASELLGFGLFSLDLKSNIFGLGIFSLTNSSETILGGVLSCADPLPVHLHIYKVNY